MSSRDKHPVAGWMVRQRRMINEFKIIFPDEWETSSYCIAAAYGLLHYSIQLPDLGHAGTLRTILWKKVLDYHKISLSLLISGELDIAYSTLRSATELARDVNCMKSNELADLWLSQKTFGEKLAQQEYKAKYKFNNHDPNHRIVKSVGKVCSKLGVHGHMSNFTFSEVHDYFFDKFEFIDSKLGRFAIKEAILLWFISFFPIHTLCASQFLDEYQDNNDLSKWWNTFVKFAAPVLKVSEEIITTASKQDSQVFVLYRKFYNEVPV
jgi:hypothetical protein